MLGKMVLALAVAALPAMAAAQAPTAADIATVRDLVGRDRAYSPAARAEAERRIAALPALLADQPRFELEVARIIALAGNGHSVLFPAQWTTRYPRSPLRLALFADGLFVVDAPPEHDAMIGSSVVAINGRPWREVRDAFASYEGGRQELRDQFVTYFMETPALLAAAGLGADPHKLDLTLRTADGATRTVSLAPRLTPLAGEEAMLGMATPRAALRAVKAGLPLYLQHTDEFYVTKRLPELEATYVRIDAIGGDKLEAFLDRTLRDLRAKPTANIILDLRANMGGDLNRGRDFAKALPALAKAGKLYVITSGRTFSAAISTLGYAKQQAPGKVIVVGEHAGDGLEFWAEGAPVALPGLGASILVATERHNYRTGCPEADCHASIRDNPIRIDSIEPDLPAPLTFAAYREGRDPAMEAIADDIRRRGGERG